MRFAKHTALLVAILMLGSCFCGTAALAASELPELIPGRGLEVMDSADLGSLLIGLDASPADGPTPMDVMMCFDVPGWWSLYVENNSGENISISEEPAATGDRLVFVAPDESVETVTVVVRGDVLGSGRLNIAQLTTMARALTGQSALTGVYSLAGDFNGNDSIDIADLTAEAKLLTSGGVPALPEGYPAMSQVAEAAYLLNPREGGDIYVEDGTVQGPLASAVLYALVDLHAKWSDPDAPATGLLGDPEAFNPLLLNILESCSMEPVEDDLFEYRFDANSIVALLNALFGFDVREELRRSVEEMEGDVFWEDDYIELSSSPVGGSVVSYAGIGAYPNAMDTYEFESRLVYGTDEDGDEMIASMWFTTRIIPDVEAPYGFLVENCHFAAAAG